MARAPPEPRGALGGRRLGAALGGAMLAALAALQRARGALGLALAAGSAALALLLAARLRPRCGRGLPGRPAAAAAEAVVCAVAQDPQAALETAREPDPHREYRAESRSPTRVHFDPRVACILVRDLTELPPERKAEFWWRQDDFDEFLRLRVEIGKAYRAAAKKIGVDVMQVSSVGSHGDEGYRAMIEAVPELAHDSRRGLGLGRKRQRAKNRDAYIAAVLEEQRRQREAALEPECADGDDGEVRPCPLDAEALKQVAQAVSEKDRHYANHLAEIYYKQDREAEANVRPTHEAPASPEDHALGRYRQRAQRGSTFEALPAVGDSPTTAESSADESEHMVFFGHSSYHMNDELDTCAGITLGRKVTPPGLSTKGFGLSRDKLKEVGLSATGHAILRKKLQLGSGSGHMSEDSDMTAGESEDDSAKHCQREMRNDVGPLFSAKSDTRTYGNRNTYRNWRAWAKSSGGRTIK